MKIINTSDMRKMDETAIKEYHIPGVVLMEHAAMAVKKHVEESIEKDQSIFILCGPGNNGGDGFALARLLKQDGYHHIRILCNVPFEKMSHDEKIFAAIAGSYQIPIYQSEDLDEINPMIKEADIVIDALFGTGLSRKIEGFYDKLIASLNVMKKYVISIDIASGIHGDSGDIMGCAIQASKTVSFECYKPGNVLYPGSAYCGDVVVESIGMPQEILDHTSGCVVLDDELIASYLPKRHSHSNKSSYGKALIIGGSAQMHGAVTMCAKAALTSGIGTLTIAVPSCIHGILASKMEECMLLPLPDQDGVFSIQAAEALSENLNQYDFVTIGNGMGRNEGTQKLVQLILSSSLPCILDGDAIYAVGKHPEWLNRAAPLILTPHPKEMSYLCGKSVAEIIKNASTIIKEFLKRYPNITLIYKDEHTIIERGQKRFMNLAGNNALAKGGSGDVLCGMLTGLYGQSKDPLQSACCAVYVHARCADELIKEKDYNSILASDIISISSRIYQELRNRGN